MGKKATLKTIIRRDGELETVDGLFYKKDTLSSINITGEDMEIIFYDEKLENINLHVDYFDYAISVQPIEGLAFDSSVANIISKGVLDLLVKYNFPIDDMKYVNHNLAELFKMNEDRAYEKLFGSKPSKVTMNRLHEILD